MNRKPTIYVAGPMRGHHDYNYPAFDRQTRVLRAQGWDVVNPADMDRTRTCKGTCTRSLLRSATSKISLDIQSRKTTIHGTKGLYGMVRARQKSC